MKNRSWKCSACSVEFDQRVTAIWVRLGLERKRWFHVKEQHKPLCAPCAIKVILPEAGSEVDIILAALDRLYLKDSIVHAVREFNFYSETKER